MFYQRLPAPSPFCSKPLYCQTAILCQHLKFQHICPFLKYKTTNWLSLTIGRQPNPSDIPLLQRHMCWLQESPTTFSFPPSSINAGYWSSDTLGDYLESQVPYLLGLWHRLITKCSFISTYFVLCFCNGHCLGYRAVQKNPAKVTSPLGAWQCNLLKQSM